jgi:hypothetical protein
LSRIFSAAIPSTKQPIVLVLVVVVVLELLLAPINDAPPIGASSLRNKEIENDDEDD